MELKNLKAGMKVKLRDDLSAKGDYGWDWDKSMGKGKVVTIRKILKKENAFLIVGHGNLYTTKMIEDKMELKIEDLKVGDELVCIDRDGFLSERRNAEYLLHNKMIVSDMNEHEIYLKCENNEKSCRNYIYVHELKYFKKKEQLQQYTFDDLIDVAVQAYKDKVINGVSLRKDEINIHGLGDVHINRGTKTFNDAINDINSLYKETFVIESEEDMKRIKDTAQITMSNKEILDYKDAISLEHYTNSFILKLLKGATVTQSK